LIARIIPLSGLPLLCTLRFQARTLIYQLRALLSIALCNELLALLHHLLSRLHHILAGLPRLLPLIVAPAMVVVVMVLCTEAGLKIGARLRSRQARRAHETRAHGTDSQTRTRLNV
jgi:hypothetical protein